LNVANGFLDTFQGRAKSRKRGRGVQDAPFIAHKADGQTWRNTAFDVVDCVARMKQDSGPARNVTNLICRAMVPRSPPGFPKADGVNARWNARQVPDVVPPWQFQGKPKHSPADNKNAQRRSICLFMAPYLNHFAPPLF
jgi:hypothetical protein